MNIQFPVDSFQLLSQAAQTHSAVSFTANTSVSSNINSAISVSTAGQQTFDRAVVAQELSDWVANAMVDFEPETSSNQAIAQQGNAFFEIEQVKPPVFDNARKDLDIDALKLESSLGEMRSMVDTLREMRLQVSQSQSKLSLYQRVNRF